LPYFNGAVPGIAILNHQHFFNDSKNLSIKEIMKMALGLLESVIREKEPELSEAALESLFSGPPESIIGDPVVESLLIMTALRSKLGDSKFVENIKDNKALEVYEVADASIVSGVLENIQDDAGLAGTIKPVEDLAAIELAKKNRYPAYEQYVALTKKLSDTIKDINSAFGAQAAQETTTILKDAKRRIAHMKGESGKQLLTAIESYLS
jgi:hypothetical protein